MGRGGGGGGQVEEVVVERGGGGGAEGVLEAAAVAPTWKLAMPTCSAISTAEIALNFSPVGISR